MSSWDRYFAAWRERLAAAEEQRQSLIEAAQNQAQKSALLLAEKYGAKRVYLFGSLLYPDAFGRDSDIDLAAEGISSGLFFKALAEANRASNFEIDLVPFEDCYPAMKDTILAEGRLLYDCRQEQGTGHQETDSEDPK